MQCGGELGEDVLFDDLRSATLARRVVGMCDSNSGDHDGESGRPGADTRPTGHVQRLPGITVVSARQAQIGRSQAQIENRIQHAGKPANQLPSGIAGDGETRTRTGDTTIFSRVLYQLSYLAVGA